MTSALAFVPRMLFQRRDSRVPNSGCIFSRRWLDPVPFRENEQSSDREGGRGSWILKNNLRSEIWNLRFYSLVATRIRRQPFGEFNHAIFARHPQALRVSFCGLFTLGCINSLCSIIFFFPPSPLSREILDIFGPCLLRKILRFCDIKIYFISSFI